MPNDPVPSDLDLATNKMIADARAYYIEQFGDDMPALSRNQERILFHIMAGFACKYAGEKIGELRS